MFLTRNPIIELKIFVRQSPDLSVDSCIIQGTGLLKACPFLQRNRNPLPTVLGLNLKQFTYRRADIVYIFVSFDISV